jgi:hypothetical protein
MDVKAIGRYFIHSRENNNTHPLVCMAERGATRKLLLSTEPIGQNVQPLRLALQAPVPRRVTMADHHKDPNPIVSDKIKDAIEYLARDSVEFVPAQIETPTAIYPYWILHSLNFNDVLDRENSEFRLLLGSEKIQWIKKLFIDYNKLSKIDKKDRMVFKLGHSSVVWLWHEEVVRAIEEVSPTGIRFTPADGYSQDSIFSP